MEMIALIYFNHLPHFCYVLKLLSSKHLYVGVPQGDNFLNMIACVQEYGCHIKAKNYPYLWIPTPNAKGRKASQIPGLYIRQKKGADHAAAGYDDEGSSYGFCVCFILKKSVDIPSRPFIRATNQNQINKWSTFATKLAFKAAMDQISVDAFFNALGYQVQTDLQKSIQKWSNPPNAPLTIANKGQNAPLVDTGKLASSIRYFVL